MRFVVAATVAAVALADPVPADYRDPTGPLQPWGIHLAYGSDPSTMMTVMWSTRSATDGVVSLWPASASASSFPGAAGPVNVSAESIPFSDVGNTQTIHRARLSGLQPSTTYSYAVGSAFGMSSPYNFTTAPPPAAASASWHPSFAIYGDMGVSMNALETMPLLTADALSGAFDAVLHIGDFAYNLESTAGLTGDAFMVQIQEVAARVPYHGCPGNHEDATDFYEYRMRIGAGMPLANAPSGGGNGTFHSINIGPVHVVMVSSEVYFNTGPHSSAIVAEQEAWLAADLAAVDRQQTPFVIVGLHQPFYCSPNDDDDDCHQAGSLVRAGLEHIIYAGGVDMVFGAHEHSYESNYPVYNSTWDGNTGPSAFVNPRAPVHVLTGAAGCPEDQDAWQAVGNPWSRLRINDYGYGRLKVLNRTALEWTYIDNVAGEVKDRFVLTKTSVGPGFPPAAAAAWRAAHPDAI